MTDSSLTTLTGSCHCGALCVAFETSIDKGALELRACQCSFCRRHAARTTSDPKGSLRIEARRAGQLLRYRFALGITEFLICRGCGVYVAAVMADETRWFGVLNVNVLDDHEAFRRPATPVDYARETIEDRRGRRTKLWTPTRVT